MVEIEKLEGGAFRVSRVFPCAASMQAGASALERVVPEAFAPVCSCPSGDGSLRWPCQAHPTLTRLFVSPIEMRD